VTRDYPQRAGQLGLIRSSQPRDRLFSTCRTLKFDDDAALRAISTDTRTPPPDLRTFLLLRGDGAFVRAPPRTCRSLPCGVPRPHRPCKPRRTAPAREPAAVRGLAVDSTIPPPNNVEGASRSLECHTLWPVPPSHPNSPAPRLPSSRSPSPAPRSPLPPPRPIPRSLPVPLP
jgi:hypothetical protein